MSGQSWQDSRATPEEYLEKLPESRREALSEVRKVILDNLPDGYEEGVLYGMISYYVPLSRHPDTYNGQPLCLASLASKKNHMSLYMMGLYGNPGTDEWFRESFAAAGNKLDMGKACVRFKKLEDLPLDVVGEAISRVEVEDLISAHEAARPKR